jgi:hypothetical protein
VGDFAYLEVKWVNEYGAFLGWLHRNESRSEFYVEFKQISMKQIRRIQTNKISYFPQTTIFKNTKKE